jgi:hypothetical protein
VKGVCRWRKLKTRRKLRNKKEERKGGEGQQEDGLN